MIVLTIWPFQATIWAFGTNVWCDKGACSHISWRWRRAVMILPVSRGEDPPWDPQRPLVSMCDVTSVHTATYLKDGEQQWLCDVTTVYAVIYHKDSEEQWWYWPFDHSRFPQSDVTRPLTPLAWHQSCKVTAMMILPFGTNVWCDKCPCSHISWRWSMSDVTSVHADHFWWNWCHKGACCHISWRCQWDITEIGEINHDVDDLWALWWEGKTPWRSLAKNSDDIDESNIIQGGRPPLRPRPPPKVIGDHCLMWQVIYDKDCKCAWSHIKITSVHEVIYLKDGKEQWWYCHLGPMCDLGPHIS